MISRSLVLTLVAMLGCERLATSTTTELHALREHTNTQDCARCHADIVDEWRGSAHASAWTDPLVAREYAAQPDPRCVGCHAPSTLAGDQQSGVDCLACHATTDIHAPNRAPVSARASSEACGHCHQFRFLPVESHGQPTYDRDAWLQDTFGEWSRSDAASAEIGCVDCHMPEIGVAGERHRGHTFPGMSDPRLLASAVEVSLSARRVDDTILIAGELRPGAIGHAFPTGDMFRAAVLRVWTQGPDADADEFVLKRWFAAEPASSDATPVEVVEVTDTRVPPPGAGAPLQVELRLRSTSKKARRVTWTLELRAAGHEGPDPLERRIPVASGSFPI